MCVGEAEETGTGTLNSGNDRFRCEIKEGGREDRISINSCDVTTAKQLLYYLNGEGAEERREIVLVTTVD